ncbi:hypothetical protein MKZ38_004224 [Zalerion maritima]|uniref:Protein Zds1 C-terminal domain-containing protein n=1 Tax=Zalerion maritima TaxID=339359 RepID=A0AAD5RLU1_9PEZI|nr:hypothetical protein MKZ38_004224 [Zalerion maritima]
MYDDSEDSPSDSRPNSLVGIVNDGSNTRERTFASVPILGTPTPPSSSSGLHPLAAASQESPRLLRTTSDQSTVSAQAGPNGIRKSMTFPARMTNHGNTRGGAYEGSMRSPLSPTLKDVEDSPGSQFPLTNIENPNDIAQELSNLQALRRMSMDVGNTTTDPDLMFSSNALMSVPSTAPSGDDDGTDPSRLLWVPASVHPEISPMEFKTFLERRVTAMKRRSSESSLSVEGIERNDSAASGGLKRKKSMLSKQIDRGSAEGYVDGAERLERKRSLNGTPMPGLTLDELVKDPTKAVQKLQHKESQGKTSMSDDLPILPMAPGMGLRRSTRTTYRKGGSLRNSKGLPFAKRVAQQKASEAEKAELSKIGAPPGYGLNRVQSEPISENFSRPTRAVRRQQKFSQDSTSSTISADSIDDLEDTSISKSEQQQQQQHQQLPARTSSMTSSHSAPQVPRIVETPPIEQDEPQVTQSTRTFPQRSSSQNTDTQGTGTPEELTPRSSKRSVSRPLNTPQSIKQSFRDQRSDHTVNDMAQHPTPLPGSGGTRTDTLTFIPTFSSAEDKKDKKAKKQKEEEVESPSATSSTTAAKSSWKWFKSGGDTKDKKKHQQQEEEKKAKAKVQAEKSQDNARLDVIDNAIGKGRESFAVDRDTTDSKLNEERRKESQKKSSETKKEKDGLFASIFGVNKKKSDKESSKKHHSHRAVSPEPSYHDLRPDVDYNWTRFPLIKERAIYRLAHMKLANPRRSLHSQVLLSNFMYSYLAKVQAMHPQMQVPQSPQQKRLEEERRRKEQEEEYLMEQQMQEDEEQGNIDQYNFEYHRSHNQYGDNPTEEQDGEYDDGGQYYDDDQGRNDGNNPHDSGYGDGYAAQGGRGYYSYDDDEEDQQQQALHQQRGERW